MSIGDLVMVNTYILQLVRPLENIGFAYREAREGWRKSDVSSIFYLSGPKSVMALMQ